MCRTQGVKKQHTMKKKSEKGGHDILNKINIRVKEAKTLDWKRYATKTELGAERRDTHYKGWGNQTPTHAKNNLKKLNPIQVIKTSLKRLMLEMH